MGTVRRKDVGEGIICVTPPMPGKPPHQLLNWSTFLLPSLEGHCDSTLQTDSLGGGAGGHFLDTLRPKVNSVMTHFTADCRILQGQNTHRAVPSAGCLTLLLRVGGWTLRWEAEMTRPCSQLSHLVCTWSWRWVRCSRWPRRSLSSAFAFEQQFWSGAHFYPRIKVRTWSCVYLYIELVSLCVFNLTLLRSGMQWKALSSVPEEGGAGRRRTLPASFTLRLISMLLIAWNSVSHGEEEDAEKKKKVCKSWQSAA